MTFCVVYISVLKWRTILHYRRIVSGGPSKVFWMTIIDWYFYVIAVQGAYNLPVLSFVTIFAVKSILFKYLVCSKAVKEWKSTFLFPHLNLYIFCNLPWKGKLYIYFNVKTQNCCIFRFNLYLNLYCFRWHADCLPR